MEGEEEVVFCPDLACSSGSGDKCHTCVLEGEPGGTRPSGDYCVSLVGYH